MFLHDTLKSKKNNMGRYHLQWNASLCGHLVVFRPSSKSYTTVTPRDLIISFGLHKNHKKSGLRILFIYNVFYLKVSKWYVYSFQLYVIVIAHHQGTHSAIQFHIHSRLTLLGLMSAILLLPHEIYIDFRSQIFYMQKLCN